MKINLLLVDDDDTIREALASLLLLEFDGKLKVVEARSGYEAIRLLGNAQIDIIISDYSMSDGTGADLLQFVSERHRSIPFIFYTSMNNPELPEVSSNFLGVVEKPQFRKLTRKIIESVCISPTFAANDSVSK